VENNFKYIDESIAKVLANEASQADLDLVNTWIQLSVENKKAFESSKKLFEQSAALRNLIPVDTDKAWLKMKSRMNKGTEPKVIHIQNASRWNYALRIAAMLVIAAGLGTAAYFMLKKKETVNDTFIAASDKIKKESLPDGSTFTLNRNSTLSFSSTDYGHQRIVHLTGEAFFEVKHEESKVFIVEAGGLKIQDVGTAFNVKAIQNSRIVFVVVESGEVKILTDASDSLSLIAGETAEYNMDTKILVKGINEDKNLSAYKDKIFIFDNTELKVIVKLLNEVYGSTIVLENNEAGSCRLTASFNNETLDAIIDIIAETLHLQIEKNNSEILLKGNACR
jgi:transmembrane sensor